MKMAFPFVCLPYTEDNLEGSFRITDDENLSIIFTSISTQKHQFGLPT